MLVRHDLEACGECRQANDQGRLMTPLSSKSALLAKAKAQTLRVGGMLDREGSLISPGFAVLRNWLKATRRHAVTTSFQSVDFGRPFVPATVTVPTSSHPLPSSRRGSETCSHVLPFVVGKVAILEASCITAWQF